MKEEMEIVQPIRMTDEKAGKVYELDFSRESVVFAERNKFRLDEALNYPVSGLRDLFYFSFRKNHRNVPREKTDKMIDERWGGAIPERVVTRLVQLYQQAQLSNAIQTDEDIEKNSGLTLEM